VNVTLRAISIFVLVLGGLLVGPLSSAAQPVAPADEITPPTVGAPDPVPQGWIERARALVSDDALEVGLRVLFGLVLFMVGWLLAKFVAWLVYRGLCRTEADDRIAAKLGLKFLTDGKEDVPNQVERGLARIVYYLLMMVVVIAVLQYAGLSQAAGPIEALVSRVMEALPLIGKAVLILVVAYLAGFILSKLVTRGLDRLRVDARFAELSRPPDAEEDKVIVEERPFSETAGRVVFWLVMVAGLAGAVDALKIAVLADPLSNALDRVVSLLPSLAIAAALVAIGYVFGKLARVVLDNLLDSVGFNRLIARIQLDKFFGESRASDVVGLVAMVFILLQAVIAALSELGLATLSEPLSGMMARFWELLPAVGISLLIAAAGVIGGRLVRGVLEQGLRKVRFDALIEKLGFGEIRTENEALSRPHQIVGLVAQVGVVLLALVQALQNVDLDLWANYLNLFLAYAVTHVGVAVVIVGVGFLVGNYVRDLILARRESDKDEGLRWMASFARYAVLVFVFTMAVHHLGVGPNFVLISFALLFGSLCLALALALGLGSREVAGDLVRRQVERARRELGRQKDPEET
jgi:hypothetical protein